MNKILLCALLLFLPMSLQATGRGRVVARSATPIQTAKTSIGPDAATTPQGRARPAVGNR
jgi:hypothetical protein